VNSVAEGYGFHAVILDDTALVHLQNPNVTERLERALYLRQGRRGICANVLPESRII
jgi:hypothetical protein